MSDALFRLIGDGDRHAGGAIPLPDAFSAVVNELLAHDSADFGKLNELVSKALEYKQERVMASAWRTWPQLTRDILTVLEEMNLAKENQYGRWELTHEFVEQYTFYLPGTKIGFTGRSPETRERWEHNTVMHMALNPVLITMREKAANCDPLVRQLILEAEKVLQRELKLDQPPETPTRYRVNNPRKPHEEGKRLRSGMSAFFREEFWEKHAKDDEWYALSDVAELFNELHPDQPPINRADLTGSMRKEGRDMVKAGKLDREMVIENGARKWKFRKKTSPLAGYAANATVVPVVQWEDIKRGPKG